MLAPSSNVSKKAPTNSKQQYSKKKRIVKTV